MADGNGNGNGSVLSLEQIANLLSTKKVPKGTYEAKFLEWVRDSDEVAIDPAEQWPTIFGSKSPATLAQSFNGLVKKLDLQEEVRVTSADERCILIHIGRFDEAREAVAAE